MKRLIISTPDKNWTVALNRPIYFFLSIIVIIALGLFATSFYVSMEISTKYLALKDITHNVKYLATLGHLRFEEILSGDIDESMDLVWELLDSSKANIDLLLEGGEFAGHNLKPVKNSRLRNEIIFASLMLDDIKLITAARYKSHISNSAEKINDKKYDATFMRFEEGLNRAEARLDDLLRSDATVFNYIQLVLSMIFLAMLFIVIHQWARHEKDQAASFASLRAADNQLRLANDELEDKVASRTEDLSRANLLLQQEIKQRAQTEITLQKERDFSQSLVNSSPAYYIALEANGRIILMNDAMRIALGYENNEVIKNEYPGRFVHPDDCRDFNRFLNTMNSNPEPKTISHRLLTRSGQTVAVNWHGCPIKNDRGELEFLFCFGIDVTNTQRAEKKAIKQERQFQALVENIELGITRIDLDLNIVTANSALGRIIDRSPNEFIGQKCYSVFRQYDGLCPDCPGMKAMTNQHPIETHFHVISRNNKRHPCQVNTFPSMDNDGMIDGFVMVMKNMSALEEAGERLEAVNHELLIKESALEEKSIVLNGILGQVENDKNRMKSQISSNMEKIVVPIMQILQERIEPHNQNFISLLDSCIKDITSPFIHKLESNYNRLSLREIEICNMLKNGLSTKDIARTLSTSAETVRKQRLHIRKKLGLSGKDVNLAGFLRNL